MKFPSQYIIKGETVAILPEFKIPGAKAQIIEKDRSFYIDATPINIVELSLLYYGSNLRGARESCGFHLGSVHRPPIMINSESNIFFYTSSKMTNIENVWLSVGHTRRLEKHARGITNVLFSNDFSIQIEVSLHTMSNNYLRGLQLKKLKDEAVRTSRDINGITDYNPLIMGSEALLVRDPLALSYKIIKK